MADILTPEQVASKFADTGVGLLENFARKIFDRYSDTIIDKFIVNANFGYKTYLQKTYQKCRFFKTLLNPFDPLDIIDNYVPLKFRTGFERQEIDDEAVIDRLFRGDDLVITGLAGSGKSIFLKSLTVKLFDNLSAGLPLYIELRNYSKNPSRNFIEFIRDECNAGGKGFSISQLKFAFEKGLFLLVLDGLDEVEEIQRDKMSAEILQLKLDFPKTKVILSSRPEDRFGSWQSFHVLKVCDLDQNQTISLIEGLKFDPDTKERFLEQVRDVLFKTHPTFLSSPLLCTIMLLTFHDFAEFPNKIHAFYSTAFDTLFKKHDANKEQFVRKIKSDLAKEDFRLVFSVFCMISYLDEKFSFSKSDMRAIVSKSLEYASNVNVDIANNITAKYIDDLVDAVCMLQRDGTELTFVHRSFQEYFTAVFIEKSSGKNWIELVDRVSQRYNDSVISMAHDMCAEKIENRWVLKHIESLSKNFHLTKSNNVGGVVGNLFSNARPTIENGKFGIRFSSMKLENVGPFESICRLYPDVFGKFYFVSHLENFDLEEIKSKILAKKNDRRAGIPVWRDFFDQLESVRTKEREPSLYLTGDTVNISSRSSWWLSTLGYEEICNEICRGLQLIKDDIIERNEARENIMDLLV